ncbi:ATP-binding protein [Roseateles sp. NT4]|uniref:ATP-binding protein n=1 Tax=Roseateles sp. NT4 TaxID=3453715 RepID=UPI003EE887A0
MNAADLPPPLTMRPRDFGLAALGALLIHPGDPAAAPEERFLRDALAAAGGDGWCVHALDSLDKDAALARARQAFGLSALETLALALVASVEDDPLVCRVIAWMQAPQPQPRPTLALLARALAPLQEGFDPADPQRGEAAVLHALAYGRALRHGLLQAEEANTARPLCETTLRVPAPIAAALAGVSCDWPGAPTPALWPVAAVPSLNTTLADWARDLAAMPRSGLVIRSAAPHEANGLAAELVLRLGTKPAWFSSTETLPPGVEAWLVLTGRVPVFEIAGTPGAVTTLPALTIYDGPALVVTGLDGGVRRDGPMADWRVPLPDAATRAALWQDALADATLAAQAAERYRAGYAQISDHARLARLLGAGQASSDSLHRAALMTPSGRALDALAQPLSETVPDAALVVSPALRAELDRIVQRCTQRETLQAGLGAAARTRATDGVRMLFTGGSGTGKSLAGQWLAHRLGLPIYRVDLAAMLSKWIGDTEKNLAELLARAEHADAVLLFDEADTLFGKRTEVASANDRFANAQTNYLLQRIETHSGIVVLTSNSRARFDPAFARRLDFIVDFVAPDATARRHLWQAHLGEASDCTAADLNRLAALGDFAGGHVRNAVLAAAAQARARGARIAYADIADGLRAEYRKLGRSAPSDL